MVARLIVVGTLCGVLALAGLEMYVLRPLARTSTEKLEARRLGMLSLAVPHKQVRLEGLAYDSVTSTVWVADTAEPDPRLVLLDVDGGLVGTLPGTKGSGISSDGDAALTVDPNTATVTRIARDGSTRSWHPAAALTSPRGIVRVRGDSVAIADTGGGAVRYFRENGDALGDAGLDASGRPELLEPRYPTVDARGRIYASDRNGRVVRWAGDRIDAVFNTRDRAAAVLSDPQQTAVDEHGRLWVADVIAGRVWVFDEAARLIATWQPIDVPHPIGLLIVGDRIFLTDQDRPLLYWFELPALSER